MLVGATSASASILSEANLEAVMQAKLDMPLLRTNAADRAEAGIRDVVIGIPIAGNIEEIEEVRTETDDVLLAKYVEVFEE